MFRSSRRPLTLTVVNYRHPRVDWLINDKNGAHHYFRLHPNARPPPAALMLLDKSKRTWRFKGGAQNHLIKTKRRRKFPLYDGKQAPAQFVDGLADKAVILVKHDDLRPANYVRFKMDRDMTKYDLYRYLHDLYNVKMAHIDIEVVEPTVYESRNVDHPENRDTENYAWDRLFRENSPDYYGDSLTGHNMNEGTTRRQVLRETPGFCIAHCYLPEGETFYFPDMFGLEATDLAEGSHDFMAETLFQFLDAKQLDSTKLENDHNLSRYRENSEMENLACGFTGFDFFAGVPEEQNLSQLRTISKKSIDFADLSAKLKQNPDDTEAIKNFIGDEGEKQSIMFNEQEVEAATDRLTDRVRLMAHSVATLVPEMEYNKNLMASPYLNNGQSTYRNVYNPRGKGYLRNAESDEVAEVDYKIIQAYFESDSNIAALLSDPNQEALSNE